MKYSVKSLIFAIFVFFSLAMARTATSQVPLPPSDNGGEENRKPGGNTAPVTDGLLVTIAMAAAFGAWKTYKVMQHKKDTAGN
ncbi:MAG: hypothetical protein ACOYNC_18325 [Bacteroidales bacterium]